MTTVLKCINVLYPAEYVTTAGSLFGSLKMTISKAN